MAKGRPIRLADPRSDRAQPELLLTIALSGCGAGIVLSMVLARLWSAGMPPELATERSMLTAARARPPLALSAETPEPACDSSARHWRPMRASDRVAAPPGGLLLERDADPALREIAPYATQADATAPREIVPPAVVETGHTRRALALRAPPPVPSAGVSGEGTPKLTEGSRSGWSTDAAPADGGRSARPGTREVPPRSLVQGVVAYLRCAGAERREARFPCPRDRALERRVWSALEQLERCSGVDPGRGAAELRVSFHAAHMAAVDWKAAVAGPSLNLRAVAKCMGSRLAQLRSRQRAAQSVVSFRFGLE